MDDNASGGELICVKRSLHTSYPVQRLPPEPAVRLITVCFSLRHTGEAAVVARCFTKPVLT